LAGVDPESKSHGAGKLKRRGVSPEARGKVIEEKREILPSLALRKRVPAFSNGVTIGGELVAKTVTARYQLTMDRERERVSKHVGAAGGFS